MRLYGRISELVSAVFRKDTYEITLRPNQSTTYTAARDVQLPAKDGNAVLVSSGDIVNGDIAAGAAIADTKLATISTAGKVSNSATTAASTNTASAIVARDGSGDFSAGTITASLSGNVTGNVTGNVSGTAGNITATSNSTLTTLSALSLPGSQVSGNISGNAANVTGTVAIANGGTGQTTQQAAMNALAGTQTANRVLRSDGTNTTLSQVNLTTDVTGTLPVANGGTGITSFGTGVATFLGTPSSANLASAVTDETGSGSLVFGTSPTLSSPQVNSSLVVQRIATPSNPSAGFDKIYTKSDGLLYKLDSSGNEVAVGSGASGSGEINAVLNPSAATDTTGWTAGTSHTVTKDSSNSPLNGIVSTSLAIASSAAVALGSQTSTSGVYDAITLPSGLQNRKLKVEFFFTTPASSAGTWSVAVYQGSTKVALSTDSGGDTILPSGVTGGKFTAYFDSSSSSAYSLNLVQRARTSANTLYITNVVVGPGIQPQGAVVGEWLSYTPTISQGFGTLAATALTYQRIGSSARVLGYIQAGTVAASEARLGLPSGLTGTASGNIQVGRWWIDNGSATTRKTGVILASIGNGYIRFGSDDYNTASFPGTALNGNVVAPANGQFINVDFTLPIAEWAGSGTLTVAQNDVEYAWNSDPGTTAGTTYSNSTYYGYGPNGTLIPAINSTTTTGESKTGYTVQFQTPVQTGDQVVVELNDGNGWFNSAQRFPPVTNNTASYGILLVAVNNTTYRVVFGNAGYAPAGATTYAAAGGPWNNVTTWRWRVRKSSAGAAVGFGIVQPGVSAGLVSASGLPGNTTGNAIASGYVGQIVQATSMASNISIGADAAWSGASLPLEAGVWQIFARIQTGWVAAGDAYITLRLTNNAGTTVNNQELRHRVQDNSMYLDMCHCLQTVVNITGTGIVETYKIYAGKTTISGSATATLFNQAGLYSTFYAIRIA